MVSCKRVTGNHFCTCAGNQGTIMSCAGYATWSDVGYLINIYVSNAGLANSHTKKRFAEKLVRKKKCYGITIK